MLYDRLSKIDDLTRSDHSFLEQGDRCYYLGEYTARGGFAAGDTNNLILNFKKSMDRRGRPEWRHKVRAIQTVAEEPRHVIGRRDIEEATFVPVPPSKMPTDPGYDDRLVQTLRRMGDGFDIDIREIITQRQNMAAAHESEIRPTIRELIESYIVNAQLTQPVRDNTIIVFDDVLTTGCHFKAMQHVLADCFPGARIIGLFVARRVPNTDDIAEFE